MLSFVRGKKAAGSPGRVVPPGFLAGRGSRRDMLLLLLVLLFNCSAVGLLLCACDCCEANTWQSY